MPAPLAYSYARFSTPEQARGQSLRRQIEEADRLVERLGYRIAERISDRGVSGFRGENRKRGALKAFLDQVREGAIPVGSLLVIETVSRLSRQGGRAALDTLGSIVDGGVDVMFVDEGGRRITKDTIDELPTLLPYIIAADVAHRESQQKSNFLSKTWALKRDDAVSQRRPMTRQTPGWLEVVGVKGSSGTRLNWENAEFRIIPERATVVRKIFELHVDGLGRRRIADHLNATGVVPWGRGKRKSKGGWHDSYVAKILSNRAVIGEYQPHRLKSGRNSGRLPLGEPIPNFFPPVIPIELWARVHNSETAAQRPQPGRPSQSILTTGLVVDQLGRPMHIERKGSGCDYLATARAHRTPGAPVYRWRLKHMESVVLRCAVGIRWDLILRSEDQGLELKARRNEKDRIKGELGEVSLAIDRLADSLAAGSGAFGAALLKRIETLNAQHKALSDALTEAQQALDGIERISAGAPEVLDLPQDTVWDPALINRIAAALRQVVRQVVVAPDGATATGLAGVDSEWLKILGDEAVATLPERVRRYVTKNLGVVGFELANGRCFVVFVTYRPAERGGQPPVVIAQTVVDRDGLPCRQWADGEIFKAVDFVNPMYYSSEMLVGPLSD